GRREDHARRHAVAPLRPRARHLPRVHHRAGERSRQGQRRDVQRRQRGPERADRAPGRAREQRRGHSVQARLVRRRGPPQLPRLVQEDRPAPRLPRREAARGRRAGDLRGAPEGNAHRRPHHEHAQLVQDAPPVEPRDEGRRSIAIVGFGYIGTCIGAVLADRGFVVTGIDPRPEVEQEIAKGATSIHEPGLKDLVAKGVAAGRLKATTSYDAVREADVVLVTVGTPLGADHAPDMAQILSASEQVAKRLRRGQLVMYKSTVPPGTTEDVVRPLLEKQGLRSGVDFFLAFCPERLAEGRAIVEFLSLPIVVGGAEPESTRAAAEFWREALDVRVLELSTARAAEMSKLADNLFIDLNVALANEIAMLC